MMLIMQDDAHIQSHNISIIISYHIVILFNNNNKNNNDKRAEYHSVKYLLEDLFVIF